MYVSGPWEPTLAPRLTANQFPIKIMQVEFERLTEHHDEV